MIKILGYTVHPGNEHDSRTFKALYDKISKLNPQMVVADAGYKTPAIAHRLLEDGIQPLFPYTRPKTKEGFFGKHDFAYDEYYNCYICPGAHILTYSTTNRNGYKEYKSCGEHCAECQYLSKCTESKDPGKTRLEHSQIFVDFEENKKKRSFKRKMVLGITPNTKFVYSLKWSPIWRPF